MIWSSLRSSGVTYALLVVYGRESLLDVNESGAEGLEPSNASSKGWCLTNLATPQRTRIGFDTPLVSPG